MERIERVLRLKFKYKKIERVVILPITEKEYQNFWKVLQNINAEKETKREMLNRFKARARYLIIKQEEEKEGKNEKRK